MKTRCCFFIIVLSVCFASCKDNIIESQYFGTLPSLGERIHESKKAEQREKYSIMISEERRKYIGNNLPCEIAKNAPLKFIEPLHITNITDQCIFYEGALLVTKDIMWNSTIPFNPLSAKKRYGYGLLTDDKGWETTNYIFGTAIDNNDSAIASLNDGIIGVQSCEYILSYMWLCYRNYRNISYINQRRNVDHTMRGYSANDYYPFRKGGYSEPVIIIDGLPDPPFSNMLFWHTGDTVYVNNSLSLNEGLINFKSIRYDILFKDN